MRHIIRFSEIKNSKNRTIDNRNKSKYQQKQVEEALQVLL